MDSLGNRMKKNYEEVYKLRLPNRMPVILRLDGKSFHTYTRGMKRPYDIDLIGNMQIVATELANEVQGCKVIYSQSDEISVLLVNYTNLDTSSWFDNEIQKIVSISASIASSLLSRLYLDRPCALFDSRAFVLPKEEVCNYFIWRQKDCERNSIQMVAQSLYSQKQLHKKNTKDLHELLYAKQDNWNNYPTKFKRGWCVTKEGIDNEIPIFTESRNYIEKFL